MFLDDDITGPEPAEDQIPQEVPPKEQVPIEGESAEQRVEKELAKVEKAEEEKKAKPKEGEEEEKAKAKPKKSADERIGEITRRFRTEERKNLALEEKMKTLEGQMKGVTDERAQEKQQEVDVKLNELWKEYGDHLTNLEGEKAAEVFRKIHELEKRKTTPKEEDIDKKVTEREAERAAENFKKRNPWFNKNSENYNSRMRKYAIVAEEELLAEGFEGSRSELLAEVEKDIKETFKGKRSSGLANVAGVNPTKRKTADNVINLTDEQRRVAHGVYSGLSKKEAEEKYTAIVKKQGGTK